MSPLLLATYVIAALYSVGCVALVWAYMVYGADVVHAWIGHHLLHARWMTREWRRHAPRPAPNVWVRRRVLATAAYVVLGLIVLGVMTSQGWAFWLVLLISLLVLAILLRV